MVIKWSLIVIKCKENNARPRALKL